MLIESEATIYTNGSFEIMIGNTNSRTVYWSVRVFEH